MIISYITPISIGSKTFGGFNNALVTSLLLLFSEGHTYRGHVSWDSTRLNLNLTPAQEAALFEEDEQDELEAYFRPITSELVNIVIDGIG